MIEFHIAGIYDNARAYDKLLMEMGEPAYFALENTALARRIDPEDKRIQTIALLGKDYTAQMIESACRYASGTHALEDTIRRIWAKDEIDDDDLDLAQSMLIRRDALGSFADYCDELSGGKTVGTASVRLQLFKIDLVLTSRMDILSVASRVLESHGDSPEWLVEARRIDEWADKVTLD